MGQCGDDKLARMRMASMAIVEVCARLSLPDHLEHATCGGVWLLRAAGAAAVLILFAVFFRVPEETAGTIQAWSDRILPPRRISPQPRRELSKGSKGVIYKDQRELFMLKTVFGALLLVALLTLSLAAQDTK